MSDYFDRLLARHVPHVPTAAAPVPPGGAETAHAARPVRVRPRLPGPFERVEALRAEPPGDDAPAPVPPVPRSGRTGDVAQARQVREIRTERETVVRGEPERGEAAPDPTPRQQTSRTTPSRPVPRPPRPVPTADRAAERTTPSGARAEATAPAPGPAPALVPPGGDVVTPAEPVRPGRGDLTGSGRGRAAQRAAATGRRDRRPADRVVHVQIGRLEVSAATPPGAGQGAAGGPGRQERGRTAPTVSLEEYLTRGRNGERSN